MQHSSRFLKRKFRYAGNVAVKSVGRTPFYAVSVNGLHRDRGRVRVSIRVRVRACRPDSSGNLLTWRKMEFAQKCLLAR